MRILFLAPNDTFSGAPLALLNLHEALRADTTVKCSTYFFHNTNQLFSRFTAVNEEVFTGKTVRSLVGRGLRKITGRDANLQRLSKLIKKYDIVAFNTCLPLSWLPKQVTDAISCKILLLYEMPEAIRFFGISADTLQSLNLIFSPAESHQKALLAAFGAVLPVARLNQTIRPEDHSGEDATAKKDYFCVGMIGTTNWAKAIEYFIAIAQIFRKKYPEANVRFLWKGLAPDDAMYGVYSSDIAKAGLQEYVLLEGKTPTTHAFYESIDVLALTSREDTYPNVMLEAALWGKPTICFQKSGGAEDFVAAWSGQTVPYLDLEAYADALYNYYQDRGKHLADGAAAREFTLENHCNPLIAKKQFLAGLQTILTNK